MSKDGTSDQETSDQYTGSQGAFTIDGLTIDRCWIPFAENSGYVMGYS